MKMYITSLLTRRLDFGIAELESNEIETLFLNKTKMSFESICIDEGFVKPNSIKVISYSAGLIGVHSISFDITFECDIFRPVDSELITCKALSITKAGIRAVSSTETPSPFVAFITREDNLKDQKFLKIEEQDVFHATIIGHRFELNDKYVSILGKFVDEKGNPPESSSVNKKKRRTNLK
jgi:DNA-directed RNA polymerase subunit E'/Rpb7